MSTRIIKKRARLIRRRRSIRRRVRGNAERPRLTVFKSARHIYAQVIDDEAGRTLAAASTLDKAVRERVKTGGNADAAKVVGETIADRARAAGVETVVFDRSGYKYHGRLQALADAAREKGLVF